MSPVIHLTDITNADFKKQTQED